jgi:hypothetical protein
MSRLKNVEVRPLGMPGKCRGCEGKIEPHVESAVVVKTARGPVILCESCVEAIKEEMCHL